MNRVKIEARNHQFAFKAQNQFLVLRIKKTKKNSKKIKIYSR